MNLDKLMAKNVGRCRHKWAKHVAFVMRGSNMISIASNRDETHAEVAALNRLWPSERKGTKMYSLRMTRSGTWAMARPCPNCWRYMKESGVKTVHYTDESGRVQMEKL
jgi:cytidine deaminase